MATEEKGAREKFIKGRLLVEQAYAPCGSSASNPLSGLKADPRNPRTVPDTFYPVPGTGLARYALEVRGYHAGGTLASPLTPLRSFSNTQKVHLGYDALIFGVGGSAAAYNVYDTYFDGE